MTPPSRDAGTDFEVRFAMQAVAVATNDVEADAWITQLQSLGASTIEIARAWSMRSEVQSRLVQTLHSTPTEGPQ